MMRPGIVFVAALLAVLDLRGLAQSNGTPPFALAVLRRDALAVPFATFDGNRWRAPWPSDRYRDRPITLDDVPESWWGLDKPPRQMALWTDGKRAGDVPLTGVTTLSLMCGVRTVVKTDYKPSMPAPPPIERPYPKDGLLVSADVPIEPITILDKAGAEAQELISLLTNEFSRSESEAAGEFTSWSHPVSRNDRRRTPITLEAVYRSQPDEEGWTAHYVEAVREYPPGRGDRDGCGLVTFATGWVMRGPRNAVRVRLSAVVTYCDRKGVNYMLPLGLVKADGRMFWIYQLSGFEGEWYEVARPRSSRTESHALYHVGTCPF